MKYLFVALLLICSTTIFAQTNTIDMTKEIPPTVMTASVTTLQNGKKKKKDILIDRNKRWRVDGNKLLTGGLIYLSGAAKGFNEALQFNYYGFENIFPAANDKWFHPALSFKNKYKDRDPAKGPAFPLSTSVLVMFTDQYHLNNFINRAAITAALVIKIGEGKKPFRHYLFDALYYTACYQAGFQSIYAPIKARSHK